MKLFRKKAKAKGSSNTNGDKIRRYKIRHRLYLAGAILTGVLGALNIWEMHKFDKDVIKNIEIAANVPSAGKSSESDSGLSMESALSKSRKHTEVSSLQNPAIIWKTPITDVRVLEELLDKSIVRSKEIEQFKNSFKTGRINESYPQWVKDAYEKINPADFAKELRKGNYTDSERKVFQALEEIAKSEYGLRIANEYEALNKVVSGGTRISAKNLSERHRSLLDTLGKAGGWRSIIRFQADDFKEAHARVFVGYLMANMGDLDKGLEYFHEAKKIMDKYPDDKNLAIIRNTPELSQKVIKGLINSSIKELTELNNDSSKYSAGWWKRLTYYNQSIGGQSNPSISDMAESINDRYYSRVFWEGFLSLALLFIAGKYGKKIKLSKQYEVKPDEKD